MDFESIKNNLLKALGQLLALRLIVSSPKEKVGDLPALFVLVAVLVAPKTCAVLFVLGLVFRYAARFEKDATRM